MGSKSLAASFAAFSAKVAKAFFAIQDGETAGQVSKKVAKTSAMRTFYAILDYWLMAASAIYIVSLDKLLDCNWLELFSLMWIFDFVVAYTFVWVWKHTGEDVTLGVSFRRAVDAVSEESVMVGQVAVLGVCIKATFWDGPEHIVIFFNKELRTHDRTILALLALSAVQSAFWTPIYVMGFDTVTELFNYLWK